MTDFVAPLREAAINRLAENSGRWLAGAGMGLLLVNVALQVVDVLGRWLLSAPQAWVSDIQEASLPIAIAACFPIALWSRSMIRIGFLGAAIGPGARAALDLFGDLVLLAAMLIIAIMTFGYGGEMVDASRGTWNIGLPLAPTWYAVSFILFWSAAILGLTLLRRVPARD